MTGPPEGCRELMGWRPCVRAGPSPHWREHSDPRIPEDGVTEAPLHPRAACTVWEQPVQSHAPPAGAAEVARRRQIPVPCWDRCGVRFQSTLSLDCGAGHSSGFSSYRKGCVPWQGCRCLGRGGLPSLLLAAAACFLPNLCHSWAAFRRVMLGYRGRGQARAWRCLLPETTST